MKTDDKLIAEFMGFNKNVFEPEFYVLPSLYNSDGPFCSCEFLRFANSWDWLMPVVEKINSIGYDVLINATGLHNETHSCDITTTTDVQAATTSKVLIECVYKAVVEFIKWHNNVSTDKKQ